MALISLQNMVREIDGLTELKKFWEELLPVLEKRCIVLLEGEVGAGKTHSVKSIAEIKNLHDVASPSFAIHHKYKAKDGFVLDHLDLYRLQSEDDLESTGFWDLFSQESSLVIIEWPQRLNIDELPLNWRKVKVKIEICGQTQRRISVEDLGY